MKETLENLLKFCDELGEDKVVEAIDEAYSNGGQSVDMLFTAERSLQMLLNSK